MPADFGNTPPWFQRFIKVEMALIGAAIVLIIIVVIGYLVGR